METMRVDVPVEMEQRFNQMLDKFARENNVNLVSRVESCEDQPRH